VNGWGLINKLGMGSVRGIDDFIVGIVVIVVI
jgi:hypothetical protein